jgi:hypothetical protein
VCARSARTQEKLTLFLKSEILLCSYTTEVKIKPEHTVGAEQTHVEPITQRTVEKLVKPETVEVCKSSSKNK